MFDEKLFREKYNLMTQNIPDSMRLMRDMSSILVEMQPEIKNTPDYKHSQEVITHFVKCGGTFTP